MNHNDHWAQVQDSLIMSYVAIDNLNTTMMKQTEWIGVQDILQRF